MKIQIAAAILLSTTVFSAQQRGWVWSVTATPHPIVGTIQFVIRGSNPCDSVNLDHGDGTATTHSIRELPVTVSHEYTRVGNYLVRARGMGNCEGNVTTNVNVSSVRQTRPDPLPPGQTPIRFDNWTDDQFRQLDRNGDGFISRGEWRFELEQFQRVDRNNDDRLSRIEFLDGDGPDKVDRPDKPVTITVSSRQAWTDTGLNVRPGDELRFHAKGKIQFGPGKGDTAGPNGAAGRWRTTANAPLPRTAIGALIARVGNSAPFFAVTKGKRVREPEDGRLYLGINDDSLEDNSGEFRVTISIKTAKAPGKGK